MIVIIKDSLNKNDVEKARADHKNYIKVTIDIKKEIVAIGGEYHADAEKILLERYDCTSEDIFGGGYNITTKEIEFIAMLNLRPNYGNSSMEILDQDKRNKFKEIAERKLKGIESLV